MGRIQLAALSERLDDSEIDDIRQALKERGVTRQLSDEDADSRPLASGLDDDMLRTFIDQLADHDIGADIYLPFEFEGTFEIGDLRVASSQSLYEMLEELKDEFGVEEDDEGEDEPPPQEFDPDADEDEDMDLMAGWTKYLWRVFFNGARESVERRLPLHVYG